jgi:hypothetical protein
MDLNQDEIDLLIYMVESVWDKMNHFQNGWTDEESEAAASLYERAKLAQKQLRSE